MLPRIYLLALIGFSISFEIEKVIPSRYEIEGSINRTIEEVEKLIRENPSLPKLSRTDIVNILYNITLKDISSIEDGTLDPLQKMRANYQRALMVVLPYKLQNSENLKDLYTKPPMVQMLVDEASDLKKHQSIKFHYNSSIYLNNNRQKSEDLIESKQQLTSAHMKVKNSEKFKIPGRTNLKDFQIVKVANLLNHSKTDFEPQNFNYNLNFGDLKAEASHTSIATKRPIYKGTFSRYRTSTQTSPKLKIIYSSTSTITPIINNMIDKTTVQNKSIQNILSSDQWHYYAPPTTPTNRQTTKSDNLSSKLVLPTMDYFLPITQNLSADVILNAEIRPTPIFLTPSVVMNHEKIHLNTKTDSTEFRTTATTIHPIPIREEVKILLKSIGLQPIKSTGQQNNLKFIKNSIDTQLNSYLDSSIKNSQFETMKSDLISALKNNSFQVPSLIIKDDIKNFKNLSPDIQLLFQQFGLQMPNQKEISITTTPKTTITTASINSYTHFKPLPTSSVRDKDFRTFLAKFGLGNGENRNDKTMQFSQKTKRLSLIEAIPENMKKILESIGLIKIPQKVELNPKQEIKSLKLEKTSISSEHIFKPYESTVEDTEQNKKIKYLLNTVKMVQEGRANVQDVQDIANDLIKNTKSFEVGPDPFKLEEILNNYKNTLKNEVKRHPEQLKPTTTTTTSVPIAAEGLNETTLPFMVTTDSSGSFSEFIVSSNSTEDKSEKSKTDQSSKLLFTEEKLVKPSFFDTFEISNYFNKTDKVNNSTTITSPSTSGNTMKHNFFDYMNKTTNEDSYRNPNISLSDLEASFGGSTAEPDPMIPTRPKTGLYFLVDWNTFLEVGEEGKEKVNLRFSPKVGDRTRFISIKMP